MIECLFSKYYAAPVEVKDYDVFIDGKSFFDTTVKINRLHMKKLLK